MWHQISHISRRILYGLAVMLALVHCCWTAPTQGDDLISHNSMGKNYTDRLMRNAKAAEMESFMNKKVDPCNNFYEFACGNWLRYYKANQNQYTTGLLERLTIGMERKLKQILINADEKDTHEDMQVRSFYESCMAVTSIDDNYRGKLKYLIKEFGAMPVLKGDKWEESSFDWIKTVAEISNFYGLTIIIGPSVGTDFANNKVNVMYIEQQEFGLETRGMYLDESTKTYRQKYKQFVKAKLVKFLGIEDKLASTTASEIIDFEVELAKGLPDDEDVLQVVQDAKQKTIAEMQRSYGPILDIEKLVNISFMDPVDKAYDYNPLYKRNLIDVIQRIPKRIVANYIFYKLIEEFAFVPDGTVVKREHNCLDITKKYFSKNLDNVIYRRHNDNATAADIELIWRELKDTFKQQLQSDASLDWISKETRQLAIEKLTAMTLQVNSHADEDLSKDFEEMYLNDYDYLHNLENILKLTAKKQREQLKMPAKPLDSSDLSFTPANLLLENIIKVPVALLQPYYLWAANYPNAIKFGTIASLIGHELIHGFDSEGRKFNAQGNLDDWWDKESTRNFVRRQHCFTDQYSQYSYNGQHLPISDAQSENIADNGGVRLAYTAYLKWLNAQDNSINDPKSDQYTKERLPSLNYTNKQLFFISFAQNWCNDVHPAIRQLQVATDHHVVGQFRVIGALSNFEEFAKEFQCKLGTYMNPVSKCKIY